MASMLANGTPVSFEFSPYRVSFSEPVTVRRGEGVVVGECIIGTSWGHRVQVTESNHYRPGDIVSVLHVRRLA